jgi:serine/threonine protein kinase
VDALERLRRELAGQRLVRGPRVLRTVGHEGTLYLAVSFVEGRDLREILKAERTLAPQRALALLAQVADALDDAHEAGVVHRDVKPANIVVAADDQGDERAYICDLDVERHAPARTIGYISPEEISGAAIDGRADVYSLGCVLFECLAGEPPFDRETDLAVVFAHLHDAPPRLSASHPDFPAALDDVFTEALAKEPLDRYRTCADLVAAARAALRESRLKRPRVPRRRLTRREDSRS